MTFFELLALVWILSGFTTAGILSHQHHETGTRFSISESFRAVILGTFGLAGILSGMWFERQKCLEEIVKSLKKEA